MAKDKTCDWCEKSMRQSNFYKHDLVCLFKHEIQLKKSELEMLKNKRPREDKKLQEQMEIAAMELKHYLTENYFKTISLYKKIIQEDNKDPIEKINEMNVSETTRENYVREWVLYTKWLKENKETPSKESANTYIGKLEKCKPSTQKRKLSMLQLILQHIIDPSIKLNKFGKRISFAPKHALSEEEITNYLKEQKKINFEDYLIQKFMIIYGLRVNTCSALKLKDLEFLSNDNPNEENQIHLPDSKTKKFRVEKIDEELMDLFKEHIEKVQEYEEDELDEEDFIFYRKNGCQKKSERVRAQELCARINKRIKYSKVLIQKKNYKYSSHMFRKTKAYNMFHKGVSELKDKCRVGIGQQKGSSAIESYIN